VHVVATHWIERASKCNRNGIFHARRKNRERSVQVLHPKDINTLRWCNASNGMPKRNNSNVLSPHVSRWKLRQGTFLALGKDINVYISLACENEHVVDNSSRNNDFSHSNNMAESRIFFWRLFDYWKNWRLVFLINNQERCWHVWF